MKELLYKWHMLTMLYREKYEIGMRISVRCYAFSFPSDFAQMTDPLSCPVIPLVFILICQNLVYP